MLTFETGSSKRRRYAYFIARSMRCFQVREGEYILLPLVKCIALVVSRPSHVVGKAIGVGLNYGIACTV